MVRWNDFGVGLLSGIFISFQFALWGFAFYPPFSNSVDQALVAYLKDVLGPVFTGLGGAGLGALAAYKFQQSNEAEKEFKETLNVLRLVKMQLVTKLTELASVKKTSILPYADDKVRFVHIGPLPESAGIQERVDSRILNVLADAGAADAIQEILLSDQRYFACFENFKERNKALYQFRNKLDTLALASEQEFPFGVLVRALEPGRVIALYMCTENLLLVLDEAIESINSALELVGSALDEKFAAKGAKSMKFTKGSSEAFEKLPAPGFTLEGLESFIERARNSPRQ
ncbi:hypothetical protein ACNFIC_04835 [Pseudomonas sp. NY15463]|uniref:hypothetical protein n=1 Tax=Pseudomonas sp. NY15463 TaxID=3400361 RepID=UPI003A8A0B89